MSVSGRWQSIERRLPLLISGVLLVTIALFAWAAYNRAQRALLAGARERLRSAASVTGVLLGQAMGLYRTQLMQTAADTSIANFLFDGRDRSDIRRALARAWISDNIPRGRLVLRRPDGSVVADTDRGVVPAASGWTDRIIASHALAPGQAVIGPLHQFGDSVFTETVAAIPGPDASRAATDNPNGRRRRVIGYITDLRFVASSGARSIRDLIGGDATVLIGSPDGGVWSDLEHARPAPPRVEPGLAVVFWESAAGPGVGAAASITNTP